MIRRGTRFLIPCIAACGMGGCIAANGGTAGSDPTAQPSWTSADADFETRIVPMLDLETEDGTFPPRVQIDGAAFELNGAGLCEWGFLGIDLYRAALYLTTPGRDLATIRRDASRAALHLQFVRSLSREQLIDAFSASVRINAGADATRYGPALAALCAAMVSVDDGDSLTFVIDPMRQLEVFHDGRSRAVIADAPFARLFLELYLGDNPPTAELKTALLGVR